MSKKKSAAVVPAASITPAPTVRIIKVGTCFSLSGKSNLTYHIGHVLAEEGAETDGCNIMFRIHSNSSSGFFSNEWVALASIAQELDKVPSGHGITSFTLFPIFKGRSQNSPGFLLASLLNEGLVTHLPEKRRSYGRLPDAEFMAEMVELIDAGTNLRGDVKSSTIKSTSKKPKAIGKVVDVDPVMPSDASHEQVEN